MSSFQIAITLVDGSPAPGVPCRIRAIDGHVEDVKTGLVIDLREIDFDGVRLDTVISPNSFCCIVGLRTPRRSDVGILISGVPVSSSCMEVMAFNDDRLVVGRFSLHFLAEQPVDLALNRPRPRVRAGVDGGNFSVELGTHEVDFDIDPDAGAPCAFAPDLPCEPRPVEAPPNRTILTVWFGTDRQPNGSGRADQVFGNVRATSESPTSYGYARVSIPACHQEGEIERPQWWKLEFSEDAAKHMVLEYAVSLPLDIWSIDAGRKGSEGLLFIHGFNVSFANAMLRTAQLAYDLKFEGVPLCYSWASAGGVADYLHDEQTVEWSTENLRSFLETVASRLGLRRLHVIAHSMGNRALTRVLSEWRPAESDFLGEVVLAAPDVDAALFKQLIRRCQVGRQLTLYASRADRAIKASKLLHSYPRAGDADPPLVIDGLCTVDVTAAGEEMFGLGHGYFAGQGVFADLYYLVRFGLRPDERKSVRPSGAGYYLLT